jgi:osmotically-inducible protein OsmY
MQAISRVLIVSSLVLALSGVASAQVASAQAFDRAERDVRDLSDRVAAAVRDSPSFGIFDDVNLSLSDGTVTLIGVVTMPVTRNDIVTRVAKVDGVRNVVNNLRLLPVSQGDADLRMRIAQAIYGHPAFLAYRTMAHPSIHIIVEGGHVELTGSVGSSADRALANALAQVPGAFTVKNSLRIDK